MLFNIFGENYYIDIDKVEKEVEMANSSGESQIHLVKYELIKTMIEVLITESEPVDEKMGPTNSELTIPFKISFNSLVMKNIINKI
jgi:hypothetical protein